MKRHFDISVDTVEVVKICDLFNLSILQEIKQIQAFQSLSCYHDNVLAVIKRTPGRQLH